jgi:hypothetical protein
MAINLDNIATKVMKLMQGSGLQMKMFDDASGKSVAVPAEARFFYVKEPNMMVHIDDSTNELKFHIGEDIDIDNESINNMMKQLKNMARTNMLDFDIRSFGKHIEPKNYAYKVEQNKEQTMTDHVNEGMGPLSGSSRTSRQTLENVRLILKHRAPVNEESRGSRSRNITAIFVESGEGERFKYPFIHLNGARAMARHVASGGLPHDIVGEAIVELSDNLSRLKEFMGVVNKQKLVNETNRADIWNVKRSMDSIKETVQRIQGTKGYASFIEGIALSENKPQAEISEETVDTFVQKFTKSTFEESLRDIFPLLHKVNEEELENRRTNQVDRVKEIISARTKKTDEIINVISFGGPKDGYDYEQIKKQYAEPRTPEEAAQKKIDMIAMTFDDLADRIDVDTLDDKSTKKKGHDRAAELSFFLTDIANDIRKNPRGVDKEELKVAGHLLKMSKASVETVKPTSADENWNMMVESAFSKFDSDRVIADEEQTNEDDSELNLAKKKPTLDDLVQMDKDANYETGDIVVFGMKNHPAYRFDLQGDLDGETVRVASTHGETDHSGFLNIKVDDIKANIDGAAIVGIEGGNKSPFQDGNKVKSMVGWSSEDEIHPPESQDTEDDQVRMRHLAGIDDF